MSQNIDPASKTPLSPPGCLIVWPCRTDHGKAWATTATSLSPGSAESA
jgi:hypothetical protein